MSYVDRKHTFKWVETLSLELKLFLLHSLYDWMAALIVTLFPRQRRFLTNVHFDVICGFPSLLLVYLGVHFNFQ